MPKPTQPQTRRLGQWFKEAIRKLTQERKLQPLYKNGNEREQYRRQKLEYDDTPTRTA